MWDSGLRDGNTRAEVVVLGFGLVVGPTQLRVNIMFPDCLYSYGAGPKP